MNNILMRSLLFVPAHNTKLIQSAVRYDADALVFDIEDSVMPESMKQVARDNLIKHINEGFLSGYKVFVRVNDLESGHILKDLYQLTVDGILGFLYPKVKTGKDVYFFDKLLETIECEKGIPTGTFSIIPIIETAAAVLHVNDICEASKRVIALAFGSEDFITDIRAIHDHEGESMFTAKSLIVLAARANNIAPIEAAHLNIHDTVDLERHLKFAKKMGFEGMSVLNPKQLQFVHQYFSPSEEEVEDAKEMIRLSDEAELDSKGVAVMNGKFIGPPLVARAQNILKKHKLIEQNKKQNA